jgi:glutathione S-transferase
MKLYYSPASCSLASNIILAETETPYEKVKVDVQKHLCEDGQDFYAINPKGYVPYMELDNGEGLSEGVAILHYLADAKPQYNLVPTAGTPERLRMQEWMTYINSEIHKSMGGLFDKSMPEEYRIKVKEKIGKRFDWLSKQLEGKSYVMGEQFTIADAYLAVVLNWGQFIGIDIKAWAVLSDLHARVFARPKVQEALKAVGLI